MLFLQFDESEHARLVSRVTADTNHRVNEMSRISGNASVIKKWKKKIGGNHAFFKDNS